jgi:hypothetical protein
MVVGVTTTYHYEYDLAGRLILVKVNDTVTEYRYDDNFSRSQRLVGNACKPSSAWRINNWGQSKINLKGNYHN